MPASDEVIDELIHACLGVHKDYPDVICGVLLAIGVAARGLEAFESPRAAIEFGHAITKAHTDSWIDFEGL